MKTLTKKHKENLSKSMKKVWSTFDSTSRNKKISKTKKGHKVSIQTREKISKSNTGRTPWNKGKKHSQKTVNKIKRNHKGMLGKKHSVATRKKMSEAWKDREDYTGGSTKIIREIRMSLRYKLWREAVFKRDNWTCQLCRKRNNLEADHIKSFTYYPKLRFKISNGRILCKKCHKKTDNYGEKAKQHKPI